MPKIIFAERLSRDRMEIKIDVKDRRQSQNKSRCIEDGFTAQQKDERRQDNSDKERLARHHRSDLLRLLTHEWIGEEKNGVITPAL